jgi:hypothetical protein
MLVKHVMMGLIVQAVIKQPTLEDLILRVHSVFLKMDIMMTVPIIQWLRGVIILVVIVLGMLITV